MRNARDAVLLEIEGVSTDSVRDVSFSVRAGEVLGLGGVIGSGRTEIARAIFGIDSLHAGQVRLAGKAIRLSSPQDAIAAGIALVPENRKFDGLFFNFTGGPNITSASLGRLRRGPFLDHRREEEVTDRYIADLDISVTAASNVVSLLSGGNQQKIVIARWLFAEANVIVMDEPTQGIDVGAKTAVYNLINTLTGLGKAIVLISSDHNELIAMSDRIAVVSHGTVSAVLDAKEVTHEHLVRASVQ